MDSAEEQKLLDLILKKAVERRAEGFTLASGIKTNLYIDLRRITLDPEGINLIGSLVLKKIRELAPSADCVGGLETGSIPIATALALLSSRQAKPLEAVWVRKKQKDHGMQNLIEGNISKNSTVVLVDDVITTGASTLQAAGQVRQLGAKIVYAIGIVDRGALENFKKEEIPYFTFYNEKDLTSK